MIARVKECLSNGLENPAAVKHIHKIASVGVATLNLLEGMLPTAAQEVENKAVGLSSGFRQLMSAANEQKEIVRQLAYRMTHIRFKGETLPLHMLSKLIEMKLAVATRRNLQQLRDGQRFARHLKESMSKLKEVEMRLDELPVDESHPDMQQIRTLLMEMKCDSWEVEERHFAGKYTSQQESELEEELTDLNALAENLMLLNTEMVQLLQQSDDVQKKMEKLRISLMCDLQFQDRNSQVMQAATTIIGHYKEMLALLCINLPLNEGDEVLEDCAITRVAQKILPEICLAEIRNHYITELEKVAVKAHMMSYVPESEFASGNTELF